jgi:hypothetical protein
VADVNDQLKQVNAELLAAETRHDRMAHQIRTSIAAANRESPTVMVGDMRVAGTMNLVTRNACRTHGQNFEACTSSCAEAPHRSNRPSQPTPQPTRSKCKHGRKVPCNLCAQGL